MRIEELDSYYNSLCLKLKSQKPDFELNKDRAHNTTIVRFMLDNSSEVNMYCGEMSVFRDNFYKYINENNPQSEDTPEALGDALKKKLIESLKSFINRPDTQLKIFLEKFDNGCFKDLIDLKTFSEGIQSGRIHLFSLDDKMILKEDLSHVSYTNSRIVRMEKNKVTHEATCAINAPADIIDSWKNSFHSMRSVAQPISFPD